MRVNLIYAQAANGVIGHHNTMPWHLPEDLAHFKRVTQGCPVIMGRATWYSLPSAFRPLPGRLNIVLSRDAGTAQRIGAEGATCLHSLEQALAYCAHQHPTPAEVWIMGGAQIYAQAVPLAQRAVVTHIHQAFEGDAYAPTLDAEWQECQRESHQSRTGLAFDVVTYERR